MKSLIIIAALSTFVSVGSLAHWSFSRHARAKETSPEALIQSLPSNAPAGAPLTRRGTVYIAEPVIQLGRVGLNETVSGSFVVVNESSQTITFQNIMKSCGCTSAEFSVREIPPDGRAEVRFAIRVGGLRGQRAESIGVTFTDSKETVYGPLAARVVFAPTGVFEVEPPEVILTSDKPRVAVTIRSEDETNLKKLVKVMSLDSSIKVDASRLPVVVLELADGVNESVLNTECLIYTTVFGEEMIRVPVRVRK